MCAVPFHAAGSKLNLRMEFLSPSSGSEKDNMLITLKAPTLLKSVGHGCALLCHYSCTLLLLLKDKLCLNKSLPISQRWKDVTEPCLKDPVIL